MSNFRPTVLLVHESGPERQSLIQLMLNDGCVVQFADDIHSAMTAIQSACPNILIAFVAEAIDTCSELCRWLRSEIHPYYVYVIALSHCTDSARTIRLLDAGADDIVRADVVPAELLARVQTAIRIVEENLRLSQLASTDSLTGLENQRALQIHLARECSRAARYHTALTCAMIDIDHFKQINDSLGHAAGNAVLVRVADTLKQQCRESDVVCRYGGDELCVLLPETDERHALLWAERIRESISGLETTHRDKTVRVKASLGVALWLDNTVSPNNLIEQADQALLHAKQTGRDRVVGFQSLHATVKADSDNA